MKENIREIARNMMNSFEDTYTFLSYGMAIANYPTVSIFCRAHTGYEIHVTARELARSHDHDSHIAVVNQLLDKKEDDTIHIEIYLPINSVEHTSKGLVSITTNFVILNCEQNGIPKFVDKKQIFKITSCIDARFVLFSRGTVHPVDVTPYVKDVIFSREDMVAHLI